MPWLFNCHSNLSATGVLGSGISWRGPHLPLDLPLIHARHPGLHAAQFQSSLDGDGRIVYQAGHLFCVVSRGEHTWGNLSQIEAAGLGSELERWNGLPAGHRKLTVHENFMHFNPLLLSSGLRPSSPTSSSSTLEGWESLYTIAETFDTRALNLVLRAVSLLMPKDKANELCIRGTFAVTKWMCHSRRQAVTLRKAARFKFPVGVIGSKIVSKLGSANVLATSREAVICVSAILE